MSAIPRPPPAHTHPLYGKSSALTALPPPLPPSVSLHHIRESHVRYMKLLELVESERQYAWDLEVLESMYALPSKPTEGGDKLLSLSAEVYDLLFSKVLSLLPVHLGILEQVLYFILQACDWW